MKSAAHEEGLGLGTLAGRLRYCRGKHTQKEFAAYLGVATPTYQNYERGSRLPDSSVIECLIDIGWNANWILTGEGPETLEELKTAFQSHSQDMSAVDLSMAIQLTNEKMASSGLAPTPEQYGRFVLALYKVLVGGLPTAEITDFPG